MSVTVILIVITSLISYQAFNDRVLYERLLFRPYAIAQNGEWYRFITHGFVHSTDSWNHLLINMFVLYQIGQAIEFYFGKLFGNPLGIVFYVALYLSAVVISSIPSYFKHANHPHYGAVGASGATSALVFAFILFDPWQWFIFPPLPGVLLAIAYVAYSRYKGLQNNDNIGHDAHLYGALYGLFATLALIYFLRPDVLPGLLEQLMTPKGPGNLFG